MLHKSVEEGMDVHGENRSVVRGMIEKMAKCVLFSFSVNVMCMKNAIRSGAQKRS